MKRSANKRVRQFRRIYPKLITKSQDRLKMYFVRLLDLTPLYDIHSMIRPVTPPPGLPFLDLAPLEIELCEQTKIHLRLEKQDETLTRTLRLTISSIITRLPKKMMKKAICQKIHQFNLLRNLRKKCLKDLMP